MQAGAELSYDKLMKAEILQTIVFKLVVPTRHEVETLGKKLDLSKSDLNACYSRPVINPGSGENQSWYDVKLTVQGEHNLPPEKEGFYVVTEEGDHFKARFSGKKIKKLVSFEDTRMLGYATKGVMVEREMAQAYDIGDDSERKGVITKEDLEEYRGSEVILKKTCITRRDRRGKKRDIGLIDFPYKPGEPDEEGYKGVNEIAQRVSKEL